MIPSMRNMVGRVVSVVLGISLLIVANPARARKCSLTAGGKQGLLQTTIRYRPDSAAFEYRYTLTNPPDSPMRLERLVLGYTPPVTQITGPDVWLSGLKETSDAETFGLSPLIVTWRSHEGRPSDSNGQASPSLQSLVDRDVAPGETLGGFGFQSSNPPAYSSFGVRGKMQAADTEARADALRLVRRCPEVSRRGLFEVSVQGMTPTPRHGLRIKIDIRPGTESNRRGSENQRIIPVALLGSDTFSVENASDTQALFGITMTEPVRPGEIEDVNNDGHDDLVFHFPMSETGMTKEKNKAALAVTLGDPIRQQAPLFGSETFRAVWGTDRLNVAGEPKAAQ